MEGYILQWVDKAEVNGVKGENEIVLCIKGMPICSTREKAS